MIYASIEAREQEQRIDEELKSTPDKKWYQRLLIISLSAKKYAVKKLSRIFGLSPFTIRRYIHAYNQGGIEGLKPGKSPGRRSKIAHWTREDWDCVLEQTPNQYSKLETDSRQWTLERLVQYLKAYHQIDVCRASVYNSLRTTGRRTGRSKLRVGSPSPHYLKKRQSIEEPRNLPKRGN